MPQRRWYKVIMQTQTCDLRFQYYGIIWCHACNRKYIENSIYVEKSSITITFSIISQARN